MALTLSRNHISVLVLTLNEERLIEGCIRSLNQVSDDIVVLDSLSTDRTTDIARAMGARVVSRRFDDWASHSNWALEHIEFRHYWVYYSDADERLTPELAAELLQRSTTRQHVAYRVRYWNYFEGRWLKHGSGYPVWVTRFFMPNAVRYEPRLVNAHPRLLRGTSGDLQEHFLHLTFAHGLEGWFEKHNDYSTFEAIEGLKVRQQVSLASALLALLSSRGLARRRAAKTLAFLVPARPVLRFLFSFLLRGGCRDGRPGFDYALMVALYESWISRKMRARTVDDIGVLSAQVASEFSASSARRTRTTAYLYRREATTSFGLPEEM